METTRDIFSPIQFISGLLVCLIFLGLSTQHRLYWFESPLTRITTPARAPLLSLRFKLEQYVEQIKELPYQYRMIKDLERKNAQLAVVAQKVTELEKENNLLRDTLKAGVARDHKLLPARVLALARNAIIDQGSLAGVQVDQAIVIGDTYLGKVISTTPRSARVQLLNDPDTDLSATTLGGTMGTVNVKSGQLEINQILQKDPIKTEEPVYTRGNQTIPAHLLIGTTKQVDDNPAGVYKSATISPAAAITDQSVVLVVLE